MANPLAAIAGVGTIAGGIMGNNAAKRASRAQSGAAYAGIEEQRRQFDFMRELLKPYVDAGGPALEQMQGLIGLRGPEAQQAQISGIESSPLFQSLLQQGEAAMMQNRAATGGLRGGDFQAALAQFRPQMLQNQIQDRYAKLSGLATMGQNSATGIGTQGMTMASNIGNLLGDVGAARAGGILSRSQNWSNMAGGLMQGLGGIKGTGAGDALAWRDLNPVNWF